MHHRNRSDSGRLLLRILSRRFRSVLPEEFQVAMAGEDVCKFALDLFKDIRLTKHRHVFFSDES